MVFSEKFKGGQDWEYVKYKLGGKLNVDPDNLVNYYLFISGSPY